MIAAALLLAAITLPTGFVDDPVMTGLSSPMGLACLPDGRLLVTQRTGEIVLITRGGLVDTIQVVPDVMYSTEAGCSGIAVDPQWPADPYVYVQYNKSPVNSGVIIQRWTAYGALTNPISVNMSLADSFVVLVAPDETDQHNGGTLRFGPDGCLYSSLGDDVTGQCAAQDSSVMKGVILRLKVDGLPPGPGGPPPRADITPPDNPWASDPTDAALAYAMGVRNPFRFGIDPNTGYLYVCDVGSLDWEEVSEVRGGENLGWPWYEGNHDLVLACEGGPNVYTDFPVYEYPHDGPNAIFGAVSYRRRGGLYQFPVNYEGAVFFGDTFARWMRVIKKRLGVWDVLPAIPGQPDTTNWAIDAGFIVDMIQGPDDGIYYCDLFSGEVRRIIFVLVSGEPESTRRSRLRAPGLHLLGSGPVRVEADAEGGELQVFDVRGRQVAGPLAPSGPGFFRWDPGDRSPGVYFLRLTSSAAGPAAAKVVLVR